MGHTARDETESSRTAQAFPAIVGTWLIQAERELETAHPAPAAACVTDWGSYQQAPAGEQVAAVEAVQAVELHDIVERAADID